jgi:hypothetical protein
LPGSPISARMSAAGAIRTPMPWLVGFDPRLAAMLAVCSLLGCSEQLDWRETRFPGYSILLPGRAQIVTRDVEFEGQKLPVTMTSTGVGSAMFAVGVVGLPAAIAADPVARERTIDYFRDGLVRNIGGTITARGPATLTQASSVERLRAGQEVQAKGRSADGRTAVLAARFLIVDDRLFQLIALGGESGIEAQALDTFFTSFRLIP